MRMSTNLYNAEKWAKDGTKVDRLLYAGNNLEKARKPFADAMKHRPRIRPTMDKNPGAVAATGLVRFFVVPAKGFVKVTLVVGRRFGSFPLWLLCTSRLWRIVRLVKSEFQLGSAR
jgi:hypothetical protein